MTESQIEMDEAVADWLEAYRGHEHYLAATENLFGVFARGWCGSPRHVVEAFTDYRQALLKEHGLKHLEVATVFPRQRAQRE